MPDLQEILAMLADARSDVDDAIQKVTNVQDALEQSAQQLMTLGVKDRAALAHTAAQACEASIGQLSASAQSVDDAIKVTGATAGDG